MSRSLFLTLIIHSSFATFISRYINYTIVSNSFVGAYNTDGSYIGKAVICNVDFAWTTGISDASWIWESLAADPNVYRAIILKVQFYIRGIPVQGYLQVAADDHLTLTINGQVTNCSDPGYTSVVNCTVLPNLLNGQNRAEFLTINTIGAAGLYFKFTIQTKTN